jgi:two-component system, NtrC family, sensor kinase
VLKIISSAGGDLKPVFDAILDNATRICEATFGNMLLRQGDAYQRVAMHNAPLNFQKFSSEAPILKRGIASSVDRAVDTRQAIHILDVSTEAPNEPIAKFGGARTLLAVPMLKDNEAIGVLGIYRQEVRPFTDKQIELVQNFAAQAVVAIENARLLNELRQSLERQTATSEVLGIISRSPGELETVFHVILENATRICEANFGILQLLEGEAARIAAMHNVPAAFVQHRQREPLLHASPASAIGRAIATRRLVHIPDYAADAAYSTRDPAAEKLVELAGARSLINVPMLKDDELIGIISIYRQEVRPFTNKQIEVVQNFAAQAVIAIENARLLNELRESLQQQTATSEVLGVISGSPSDLGPVFDTVLANATQLCDATFGLLLIYEGESPRPRTAKRRWRQSLGPILS